MPDDLNKVCSLLDKLMLETLFLTEKYIDMKINLEKSMSDGEAHLAKSRYIMGHNNVSSLQLPTEDSPEFTAIARIHEVDDEKVFGGRALDIEIQKDPKNGDKNFHNPLRWFGVLVPQDLHKAQAKYKQTLMLSTECVNLQLQLQENLVKIKQLKEYKSALVTNKEE